MAAKLFQTILQQAIDRKLIPANNKRARNWLRNRALEVERAQTTDTILEKKAEMKSVIWPGSMYFFLYQAKWADELPYWDKFPLIFPFRKVQGGFYGINMHYLHPRARAMLMDALYTIKNNDKYDDTTRLRLTYKLLNSTAKFRFFKPCVKQYLNKQVRSRFIYIHPKEWDIALMLPLERFQKARKQTVWNQSRYEIQQARIQKPVSQHPAGL